MGPEDEMEARFYFRDWSPRARPGDGQNSTELITSNIFGVSASAFDEF